MNWQNLQNEPSEDLIEYIKCKDSPGYKQLAEAAFITLTFRFRNELSDRCRKLARWWGFDADAADLLAERTFERLWRYPFGFNRSKCGTLNPDICITLYLFRIAQRCFCDYSQEIFQAHHSPYDGTEQVIVEFPQLESLEVVARHHDAAIEVHQAIAAALATLPPKHRVIYLAYKAYEQEGFKLPRHLLKELRESTGLSQSSIRVYKREAFKKMQEHLESNGGE